MARRRGSRATRERGSTFTALVIVMSVLILTSAMLLVEATQNTFNYAALHARQGRAREAAFGGVTWAARAAAEGQEKQHGTLQLHGLSVSVRYQEVGELSARVLLVTSRASGQEQVVQVEAELKKVDGRYRLESFTAR